MIKMKFDYEKKNGEKTTRNVMLLSERKSYIDVIDFSHLNENEAKEIASIQKEYEDKLKPYTKKAFRRFSTEGMKNLEVEKVNV